MEKLKSKLYIFLNLLFLRINTVYAGSISSSNSVVTVKKGSRVLTQEGGKSIGELTDFFGDWLTKIGGIVMFSGALMFAFGWTRDDADNKTRGLQVMAAGALVVALKTFKWL